MVTRIYNSRQPVNEILRLVVAGIFLLSGALKAAAPERFLFDLQAFPFFSYQLAFATAFLLPWLELLAGLGMMLRIGFRGSLLALGTLTLAFILFLGWSWQLGVDVHCGCFGEWLVFENYGQHIAFNTALFAAMGWLGWVNYRAWARP